MPPSPDRPPSPFALGSERSQRVPLAAGTGAWTQYRRGEGTVLLRDGSSSSQDSWISPSRKSCRKVPNPLTRCKEVQAVAMPALPQPLPTPQSCERRDGKEGGETEARAWATRRLGPAWACQGEKQHLLQLAAPRWAQSLTKVVSHRLGFKCLSSRVTASEGAVPGADGRGRCRHKIPAPRSYSSCLEMSSL